MQIDGGGEWKQWQALFSWAPKSLWTIAPATKLKDSCSLERKLWELNSVLKRKGISLPTKILIVKTIVFPVVMYRCESWAKRKAEHWRIDAFKLWCWRRLLRVPWTVRRSNKSILKEINPKYSLEVLKLKLKYIDHLMQIANSMGKTLIQGKIEGRRRRGWQRIR